MGLWNSINRFFGIVDIKKGSTSSQILITHGTDRLVETANFLASQEVKDKTIV